MVIHAIMGTSDVHYVRIIKNISLCVKNHFAFPVFAGSE